MQQLNKVLPTLFGLACFTFLIGGFLGVFGQDIQTFIIDIIFAFRDAIARS
jgi:hypothetical protein